MKRIFLFISVNILVVATISILMSALGIGSYMTGAGLQYAPLLAFCFLWGMVGSLSSVGHIRRTP